MVVADHGDRRIEPLVFGLEQPADFWLHAQQLEIIAGHDLPHHCFRTAVDLDPQFVVIRERRHSGD
jgi:hypothetical protein